MGGREGGREGGGGRGGREGGREGDMMCSRERESFSLPSRVEDYQQKEAVPTSEEVSRPSLWIYTGDLLLYLNGGGS